MEKRLANNLSTFLNNHIKGGGQLPYDQNLLEQIYIQKDDNVYKSFDNARPITKTSPIYKLLDTILNHKLNQNLNKHKEFRLEKEQIGFRNGLGCEVNIMKLIESIKEKMEQRKIWKKGKIWSLYIDLKSAFDSVDHTIMF